MTKLLTSLALALIFLLATTTAVQALPWRGQVIDAESGDPVPGAYIKIVAGEESVEGLSAADGRFSIDGGIGAAEVTVMATGYTEFRQRFEPGQSMVIPLVSDFESGEVVLIVGDDTALRAASSYELTADTVRSLPGSGNDVLKSIQSLPGVSRVPFGGGGLILRGTSPRDSSVFLDGIEVPILYHFGNLASFYPSGMLDSLEVVPSGFGAQYGRTQGGLVTLESKAGRGDQWRTSGEVSLLDASVRADGPGGENSTWSMGIRRSYVDAVLAAALPDDSSLELTVAPRYFDAQIRYDYVASDKDVFTAMLFGSDDSLQFNQNNDPSYSSGPDAFRFDSAFWRLGMRWERTEGDTTISATPWIGIDRSELRVGQEGSLRDDVPAGLRANVATNYSMGRYETGLDVQARSAYMSLLNQAPPQPGVASMPVVAKESTQTFADLAFYHEHALNLGNKDQLTVKPGLRIERFGLSKEWVIDPRISLRQKISDSLDIRQSIGLYHQPPALTDQDWGNARLRSSYATQADVGATWKPSDTTSLGATVFGSQQERLPVDVVSGASAISAGGSLESGGVGAVQSQLVEEQFGSWRYREAVGKGRAYGVEFLARGQFENFFGWVAYTWSRAKRTRDPRMDPTYYRYILDQPNVLTALGSWQIGKNWKLGARFRFSTGNPFTPVAGSYYDSDSQSYRPIDGPILSDRLPDFYQLDVRVDRNWDTGIGRIGLFLDLQNATNRLNPEGVSYSFDYTDTNYTRGLPIFPSFGLELVQ